MKKLVLSAIAASLISGSAFAAPQHGPAQPPQRHEMSQRHDYRPAPAQKYRNWHRGERFDARYARNYRVVGNPHDYRLKPAPRGYHWVRSGNDAVLVGVTTGVIAAIIANAMH